MVAGQRFNAFSEAVYEKVHDFANDQLVVALSNVSPLVTNSVLTDITQIDYTNIQGNPASRNLVRTSSSQTGGVYSLVMQDLVLTATGVVPTFQYVIIYNDTATNDELVGWYDRGSPVNLDAPETFTIDFINLQQLLTHQHSP